VRILRHFQTNGPADLEQPSENEVNPAHAYVCARAKRVEDRLAVILYRIVRGRYWPYSGGSSKRQGPGS